MRHSGRTEAARAGRARCSEPLLRRLGVNPMPNRLEMLGAPADVSVRRRSSEPNGDVADARPTVSAPPDPRAARGTHLAGPRRQLAPDRLRLSDGELNFLWWFIQGSIMNPETRFRLHRRWGMCQRHSLG